MPATQPSTQQEQVDEFWHSSNRNKAGETCQILSGSTALLSTLKFPLTTL